MKKNNMTKTLLLLVIALGMNASALMAQVKIGGNPKQVNEGAMLEVEADSMGMLLPRVDIEDLSTWAPLKGDSIESMMVYNTNETTGKGFYFWNGEQWVISAGKEGSIWVKQNDSSIKLTDENLNRNTYYGRERFYTNIPTDTNRVIFYYNADNNTVENMSWTDYLHNSSNASVLNIAYGDEIPFVSADTLYKGKSLERTVLLLDDKDTSDGEIRAVNRTSLHVTANCTREYSGLNASVNSAGYSGSGNAGNIIGTYSVGSASRGSVGGVFGAFNQATSYAPEQVGFLIGSNNLASVRGSGSFSNIYAAEATVDLRDSATSAVDNISGILSYTDIGKDFLGSVNNLYGVNISINDAKGTVVKNQYGLRLIGLKTGTERNFGIYVNDVGNTTATDNYAIFTRAGKVRFGDNVGVGVDNPTEKLEVSGKVKAANVIFTGIPEYADDAAAGTGGLVSGEMYRTATGELRIKL